MRKYYQNKNLHLLSPPTNMRPSGHIEFLNFDMGNTLSGGQKQRVILARALYKRPKLLFLDEATSHLDTSLESHVNNSIKYLKMTRIIIAHRPETIKSADRVLLMDKGQLIEVRKG